MASWDLIIWTTENSCDLVPSSWAVNSNKNLYLYPTNIRSSKIKKLIKNCSEPSTEYQYEELEATFKKTVQDLTKGERLLSKLQFSSAVETDDDYGSATSCSTNVVPSVRFKDVCGNEETVLTQLNEVNKNYKLMLHLLTKISIEVKEINCTQNEIKNMLVNNNFNNVNMNCDWPIPFPLASLKDVEEAEKLLPEKQHILATILSLVGGHSLRHSVTLMLKKLLSKDLALEFSGKGRKGKKDFSKTKLSTVIIDATRRINNSATESSIGQMISFSLASAGDWDGCNRRKKTMEATTSLDQSSDEVVFRKEDHH